MANGAKLGEQDLLGRLAAGDTTAFDQLFLAHYTGLLRFAKMLMPYPSDGAEDIVASVFGYFWEYRNEVKINTSLTAYLYTAVKNKIIKETKRGKLFERENELFIPEMADMPYYQPDSLVQYKELNSRIRHLIGKLPERSRMVFLMNRDEKLTYEEIAVLLEISIHSVKTHMYRALLFLKTAVFSANEQ